MKTEPIVIQRTYQAPVKKVWAAITDLSQMKEWYFDNIPDFKPEPGFSTQFNIHHEGKDFLHIWKVTEVVPLKKIAYEWSYGGYPGNSLVSFELAEDGDNTILTLTHSGLETFQYDTYPELAPKNFTEGWTGFIGKRLKEYVEREV